MQFFASNGDEMLKSGHIVYILCVFYAVRDAGTKSVHTPHPSNTMGHPSKSLIIQMQNPTWKILCLLWQEGSKPNINELRCGCESITSDIPAHCRDD